MSRCAQCALENVGLGLLLLGTAPIQTTTPTCMKIGRDVTEKEIVANGWPRGTVRH